MPTLNKRKCKNNKQEYSDHFIRSCIKGEMVTYQVLVNAIWYLRRKYEWLDEKLRQFGQATIDEEDVIYLRKRGYLKTKKELEEESRWALR